MTINSTPIVAESSSEAGQPPRPKRDLTAEWGKKDIKDIKHLTDEQITEEILKSCRYMAANPETVKKSGLSSLPYNVQDTWELVHVVKKLVDNSIAQYKMSARTGHIMLSIMFELMNRNQRLSGEKEDMKNELTKAHQEIIKRDEELARREGQERRKEEERERPALPSLDLEENIGRIGQQHGLDVFSAGRRWNWGDSSSITSSTESLESKLKVWIAGCAIGNLRKFPLRKFPQFPQRKNSSGKIGKIEKMLKNEPKKAKNG